MFLCILKTVRCTAPYSQTTKRILNFGAPAVLSMFLLFNQRPSAEISTNVLLFATKLSRYVIPFKSCRSTSGNLTGCSRQQLVRKNRSHVRIQRRGLAVPRVGVGGPGGARHGHGLHLGRVLPRR